MYTHEVHRRNINFSFFIRRDYSGSLKMTYNFKIIFIILFFFSLNFNLCCSACARAEYEMSNGECCPMCAPGNRVYRDCTEYTSTTCVPCMGATFLDAPNGLKECFICTECDPGLGLRVKTACTRTSDAVCEPLEEHYCTNENRGSCIKALKHTKCSPGEYIKQIGTAKKNTLCGKCAEGTYSNGSIQTCQPHSKCEDLGLREKKAGTAVSDAECGEKPPVGLIVGIIGFLILIILAAVLFFLKKRQIVRLPASCTGCAFNSDQNDSSSPQQETTPEGVFIHKSDRPYTPDPAIPLRIPEEMSEEELT